MEFAFHKSYVIIGQLPSTVVFWRAQLLMQTRLKRERACPGKERIHIYTNAVDNLMLVTMGGKRRKY